MQQIIGTQSAVHKFDGIEESETRKLLKNLLDTPDDFAEHVRHMTGSIILRISYGYHALPAEDPFIKLANKATEQFSLATSPGGFVANLVPPLLYLPDWFPGAQFKSITADEELDLKWSAASLYSGGADTTVASINAFIRFMAANPDVQTRAHAEIDSVVGTDRLPAMPDRPSLPYVNALVLEVLRSHVVVPTGAPHRVTEDDVYEGYFIPKGSLIMPILWSMLHDERTYRHPMEFCPERFLASEGRQPERDPRTICFGFGRRICPGRELADISLFFACTSILSVFEISKWREGDVEVAPVEGQMSGSFRPREPPSPFDLALTRPRTLPNMKNHFALSENMHLRSLFIVAPKLARIILPGSQEGDNDGDVFVSFRGSCIEKLPRFKSSSVECNEVLLRELSYLHVCYTYYMPVTIDARYELAEWRAEERSAQESLREYLAWNPDTPFPVAGSQDRMDS
ncbi:cytochrome P450 [Schizophyllum commune H4-8]|nr:cytochrome P450 [Schizophyllum commune H4-8]KAI5897283.1 cytochrome P450 [Schizophyllum commune H4-8]